MTLIYNTDIFQKFKAMSIQSVDELVVGETVYSNFDPEKPMPVLKIMTDFENRMRGGFVDDTSNNEDPRWVATGPGEWDRFSLHDYNVLASYNPWLLFKTQALARQCAEELEVIFEREAWDDGYDYYRNYDDRDEDEE